MLEMFDNLPVAVKSAWKTLQNPKGDALPDTHDESVRTRCVSTSQKMVRLRPGND
jgi:hypothetical protein